MRLEPCTGVCEAVRRVWLKHHACAVALALLWLLSLGLCPPADRIAVFLVGNLCYQVRTKPCRLDAAPFLHSGRVLVPAGVPGVGAGGAWGGGELGRCVSGRRPLGRTGFLLAERLYAYVNE